MEGLHWTKKKSKGIDIEKRKKKKEEEGNYREQNEYVLKL